MKNFVKHIFAFAICAAALLSSCIKEQPYELNIAQLEVAVTRADASDSEKQGDGIGNAKFWVFECGELDSNGKPTSVSDNAISWRFEDNLNLVGKVERVHMELPLCDEDYQNYILVAVLNTEAFGSTITLDKNTTFSELQQALFDASSAEFWKRYPSDGDTVAAPDPWKMPISNWKTFTVTNDNTHPSNCYELNLPVYRAVAKSQLFVKPASDNFTVTVNSASICSSAMPTNGAILTSNVKSGLTNNTIKSGVVYSQEGNAGDDVSVPDVVPNITYTAGAAAKPLHNDYGENSALAFSPITASATDYTWVGSTFIYENEEALPKDTEKYDAEPTGNAGYYMQISYTVSEDDAVYTKYVALPAVVRNHDYQVKATVNAGGEMIFNIVVNEWLVEEQVLNYQDIATVTTDGHIKWSNLPSVAGQNIINASGQVESGVINLTAASGRTATFTFTLATPVTGRWIAELRTVKGDAGDIVFADGSTVMEGDIDNIANVITIKNLSDNLAQSGGVENRVTLHIYAKAYWGDVLRSYRVDGIIGTLPAGVTVFTDYTIVQPTQ
ncbi:MAG: hypothetical protein J6R90_00560 [Alistipes sp.]|nr:hypothetical protein [Alistipes sp.]